MAYEATFTQRNNMALAQSVFHFKRHIISGLRPSRHLLRTVTYCLDRFVPWC